MFMELRDVDNRHRTLAFLDWWNNMFLSDEAFPIEGVLYGLTLPKNGFQNRHVL